MQAKNANQNGAQPMTLKFAGTNDHIFFKGSRVEFNYKGELQYGIVESTRGDKVHVLTDKDARVSGPSRSFRHSDKPAPARAPPAPCPFKKGDRVEYIDPKSNVVSVGTVKSVLEGNRLSVITDDGYTVKWGANNFRPSAVAKPRVVNPFAVGDRVSSTSKGKTVYGTVKSVRDERVTVNLDDGCTTSRGHFSCFSLTDKPYVDPEAMKFKVFVQVDAPTPLDCYGVTKYRPTPVKKDVWEGHEGNGYSAVITKNGKPVLEAYNQGIGGCGDVGEMNSTGDETDAFLSALKAWYIILGGKECDYTSDVLDIWVDWYVNQKPSGKLGTTVVASLTATCDQFRK